MQGGKEDIIALIKNILRAVPVVVIQVKDGTF